MQCFTGEFILMWVFRVKERRGERRTNEKKKIAEDGNVRKVEEKMKVEDKEQG